LLPARDVQFEADITFGAFNQIMIHILPYSPTLRKRSVQRPLALHQGASPGRRAASTAVPGREIGRFTCDFPAGSRREPLCGVWFYWR
jgi:hypothetical protein